MYATKRMHPMECNQLNATKWMQQKGMKTREFNQVIVTKWMQRRKIVIDRIIIGITFNFI